MYADVVNMGKPCLLVCGASGSGKTTEVLRWLQDSYYLTSDPDNYHFYKRMLRGPWKDLGLKMPKRIKLIDRMQIGQSKEDYSEDLIITPNEDEKGNLYITDYRKELMGIATSFLGLAKDNYKTGKPQKYQWFISDETGTFLNHVHDQIAPEHTTDKGKPDARKAYPATGAWSREYTGFLRQLISYGIGVCFIFHDREPEGEKKGGPKAVSGAISDEITQLCSGSIQRCLKNSDDPGGAVIRYWNATADENWNRKLRGLLPDDADKVRTMDLGPILTELAGYNI